MALDALLLAPRTRVVGNLKSDDTSTMGLCQLQVLLLYSSNPAMHYLPDAIMLGRTIF